MLPRTVLKLRRKCGVTSYVEFALHLGIITTQDRKVLVSMCTALSVMTHFNLLATDFFQILAHYVFKM